MEEVAILNKAADISRYAPLSNFVLLKRIDEAADISAGGMIIPDIAKTRSNKGRVIAVGEGRFVPGTGALIPIPLALGDIVLFSKYGAEEVNLDGEEFLLLRYDEIKLKEKLVIG